MIYLKDKLNDQDSFYNVRFRDLNPLIEKINELQEEIERLIKEKGNDRT